MVVITIILSILICLYFYIKAFYLNHLVKDRLDFLIGIILGFSLSLFPIFTIHIYLSEIFEIFQTNYQLNNWNGFFHQFINVFLYIGIPEEVTKLLVSLIGILYLRRKKIFSFTIPLKEKAALVFMILAGVSLGFSLIENIAYAYNYQDLTIIILRSLISTIFHVVCGVEMGYGLSHLILNRNKIEKVKWILYSLLVPITIHSLYDTLIKSITNQNIYFLIVATLLSYEWVGYRLYKLRNILREN